ncbi:hypothetical protein IDH44_02970 [Paenibacillus sp. IB182496]|uniref:Uncharacterized protein n=1 Tax=Paenibacillus sabuli TaxID=2772509 RepID=A0A927BP42_9BACL|nr:hypothetical protein [Paenibacillus sabuli]MBD2844137.1 hypothetical protein [Paenibacillus sabuli]
MGAANLDAAIIDARRGAFGAEPQPRWAAECLERVLLEGQLKVRRYEAAVESCEGNAAAALTIVLEGADGQDAAARAGQDVPSEADSFAILRFEERGATTLSLVGRDARGLMYAILELTDVARHAERPLEALAAVRQRSERPANIVRSVTRLFTSEPEDKPWFYDRSFWDEYLTELATHRFNRFTLGVGTGYDYLIDRVVPDSYFCFFYPFVLAVPGYDVRVVGLAEEERALNLETLRYIAAAAETRGLDFRLGLWNHAYDYGPRATEGTHSVVGLDPHCHAAYCRDALALLLRECPGIRGLTFRVHFEGGVPEPTHQFWTVVLERVGEAEQLLEIDFHAKGVGEQLIELVGGTGKRLMLSTKYWAEHMGPAYHQASIREKEFGRAPSTGHHDAGAGGMAVTSKRSYTRYGYADFMREGRSYAIIHRIWPGTQRVLMWGDPEQAAGIGRYAGFQGSEGVEWFDPLSFKGKKGSGRAGGREVYTAERLKLGLRDWTKYCYAYRLWGRLAYNPVADPDEWRRYLRNVYGSAADACERALAQATRILPFVTLVHAPSVANNVYWPEMYTNIPLVRGSEKADNPYAASGWPANADFDMEPPYTFGNASPLDPVQVYRIDEFADDLIAGRSCGKLTPSEIADRLQTMAEQALLALEQAERLTIDSQDSEFMRLAVDVRIMAGLGRFFADKYRAGLAFAIYERAGGKRLLTETLAHYRAARDAWQAIVSASKDVYHRDLTFGHTPYSRGHWSDRIAAIDEDIEAVARIAAEREGEDTLAGERGVADWLSACDLRTRPIASHLPQASLVRGQPAVLRLTLTDRADAVATVRLFYRHVNQAESYKILVMDRRAEETVYEGVIPGAYTDSPYGLLYFFELAGPDARAWQLPGLDDTLSRQPYYVMDVVTHANKE